MYPNLKAELVRRNMTIRDLSEKIKMPTQTLYGKTSGKNEFTYSETVKIKKALDLDIPLETLFCRNEEV